MELRLDKESLAVYKALASETRLNILTLLAEHPRTISELATALSLSKAVLSRHMAILDEVGLIGYDRHAPDGDGRKKVYSLKVDRADIVFPRKVYLPYKKTVYNVGLGYFSDVRVQPTCGLADKNEVIGKFDDPRTFASNERIHASLLWLSDGYVEYRIPNLLAEGQTAQMLEVSLELSSEYPVSSNAWPSDITFTVNGVEVGTWTCPGNFSDVRGKLTPSWWNAKYSQYGLLKYLRVNRDDTGIDGVKLSNANIDDLALEDSPFITLRIGIKPDAINPGGLTIFGKDFGNYPQDITISLYYTESH